MQRKTILIYPDQAIYKSKLWQTIQELPIEESNNPKKRWDIGVYHELERNYNPYPQRPPKLFYINKKVINLYCTNILKNYVDKIWERVAGYGITINPLSPPSIYVKKSIYQYKWDGKIMTTPQKPEHGYVYQKYIDTHYDGRYRTLRIPVIGNQIPFLIIKNSQHKFKGVNNKLKKVDMKDEFTPKEINMIKLFIKAVGLDFGELDVLRDRDGKIYCVDVNDKPGGPSFVINEVKQGFINAFKEEFL